MQNTVKISILTVTNRKNGLELARKSLGRQTFKDFEWVVVSPLTAEELGIGDEVIGKTARFRGLFVPEPPKKKGNYWNLNTAYNEGLRMCSGELVVSIQDFIYITPQGLEKFWLAYQQTGGCITGVGDQYAQLDDLWKPINKIWEDPRRRADLGSLYAGSFYECMPNDWELNWACAPLKAFYDIGGFDEELDKWAGGDNISVCERMDALGWKFYIDQTNESFSLKHGRPDKWDENHCLFNGKYRERKEWLIDNGKWPVFDFLKQV